MKTPLQQLLEEIEREVRYTRRMTGRSSLSPRVMQVMADTPRERFVPDRSLCSAYENRPLSIGCGQTISQPFVVALMTDLLDLEPEHRVLDIGTGSGYQAAILSQLCGQVYSIECVPELARSARQRLRAMQYRNILVHHGNGYEGWPEHAPYDRIMVTAGATHIPEPLLEQLRPGGRMVIPVGPRGRHQELTVVDKTPQGDLSVEEVLGVVFVPFQGEPL